MKLGLNLSFATKRWLEPAPLAAMCRHDFNVKHIQFTWDLIDPWWPGEQRDLLIKEYRDAFEAEGLSIDATFGGLAAYTYAQLLAPSEIQREISFTFFKRAIDLTAAMGAEVMGTPIGGMTYDDAKNETKRAERYRNALDYLRRLAEYGKEKGLKEIHIEATPLITEFPHSPEAANQMMKDLEGSAIPFKLLIDWGHAIYKPLLKEKANMALWLKECAPYIGSIHLQQTDGLLDRHWDFTQEGIVTPELIKKATKEADLEHIVQYLEVVTAFESSDEEVYEGMKKTMDYLHRELDV
ncbi:MAG TPA: TIM barrel protein [Bacillota bacterium]|nr:TIM barrel protein [Bacillota bacterium]